jgi:hypothetical protein
MDRIWQDIQNPGWWLSIFVVSILVNVVAAYAKTGTDKLLARNSEKRRRKLATATEQLASYINDLSSDTHSQTLIAIRSLHAALRGLLYWGAAASLMFIGFIGFIIRIDADTGGTLAIAGMFMVALLFALIAMSVGHDATKQMMYVEEALRLRRDYKPS